MSDNQVIPEAAVEAAAKMHQALVAKGGHSEWDELDDGGREVRRRNMRAALEAAALYMGAGGDRMRGRGLNDSLGARRAQLISELWPHIHCSYFELAPWAQEHVDGVIADEPTP